MDRETKRDGGRHRDTERYRERQERHGDTERDTETQRYIGRYRETER